MLASLKWMVIERSQELCDTSLVWITREPKVYIP